MGAYGSPTWLVGLWLDNDRGSHDFWADIAREALSSHSEALASDSEVAFAVRYVADSLKEFYEEQMPDVDGMWLDLLHSVLEEVDWSEIASGLVDVAVEALTSQR